MEVLELDKVIQRELKLFVAREKKDEEKSAFAILDELFQGVKKKKKTSPS